MTSTDSGTDSPGSSPSHSPVHQRMEIEEEEPQNKRRTRGRAASKSNMVPPPPNKELLPWIHQKNQGHRLIVSKQCEDEFYKDQGGKNHHLAMVVRLVPEHDISSMAQFQAGAGRLPGELSKDSTVKIPLKTSLLYENGAEVEEGQKIFKSMIPEHDNFKLELRYADGYWCYEGEVKFRLEKVSLRCDGKKFKLAVTVDTATDKIRDMESDAMKLGSKTGALASWIKEVSKAGGCETVGINVLSKKKSHPHAPAQEPRSAEDTSRSRGSAARSGPSHSSQPHKKARTGERSGSSGGGCDSSATYSSSAAAKEQQQMNDIIINKLSTMQESFEIGMRNLQQRLGAIDQRLDFLQQSTISAPPPMGGGRGGRGGVGGRGGSGNDDAEEGSGYNTSLNRLGSESGRGVSFGDSNGRARQSSEPFQGHLSRMSSTGEGGQLMSIQSMDSFEGPLPLGNLDRMASLNMAPAPPGGLGRLPSWQPDLSPYPSDGSGEGASSVATSSNANPPREADGSINTSFERQPSFSGMPSTSSAMDALTDAASSAPKASATSDEPPPPTPVTMDVDTSNDAGRLAGPPKLRKGSSAQD